MNQPTPQPTFFDSTRGRVAYTDNHAGGPAVVLVHGLPTSKELWTPVIPLLDAGYRILAFDLNGYGQSEKRAQPISHKQRAAVLDELRAHWGLERFHLVAHDLGASVAVETMGAYGERVEKLVLISPPVYPDFQAPAIVRLARTPGLGELLVKVLVKPLFTIGIHRGMAHPQRFTPELHRAFAGPFTGPEGQAALLRLLRWGQPAETFAGYPAILRGISAPTLIIQGRRDPYIPLAQTQRLLQDIRNSRLHIIEDGSHFLPMDTPEEVGRVVAEFLRDG